MAFVKPDPRAPSDFEQLLRGEINTDEYMRRLDERVRARREDDEAARPDTASKVGRYWRRMRGAN